MSTPALKRAARARRRRSSLPLRVVVSSVLLGFGIGGAVTQAVYLGDVFDGFTLLLTLAVAGGTWSIAGCLGELEVGGLSRERACSACFGSGLGGDGLLCRRCDGTGAAR